MNILLVEDEPNVASLLHRCLSEDNHKIGIATNGKMGLDAALSNNYDLILLDIMLPELSGLQVLEQLQLNKNTTPVILLTALNTTEMLVKGLNMGADDYIVKPFKIEEIKARINALKRRLDKRNTDHDHKSAKTLGFQNLSLNDREKKVYRANTEIKLTATEFKLLKYLLENKDRVLSRENILEKVWGVDYDLGTNVVDVYINYLRKKINDTPDNRIIHTIIGMGYVIRS